MSSTRTFSTKSATWLTHDQQIMESPQWFFKWIWKIDTMPKIKIFLWQMCHNALPVGGALFRKEGRIDPQCPLCLNEIETTEHLFKVCPTTYSVWELAIHYKWIPQQVQLNHTQNWLQTFGTLKNMCYKTLQ